MYNNNKWTESAKGAGQVQPVESDNHVGDVVSRNLHGEQEVV